MDRGVCASCKRERKTDHRHCESTTRTSTPLNQPLVRLPRIYAALYSRPVAEYHVYLDFESIRRTPDFPVTPLGGTRLILSHI
jgi:hypothetical protein